MVRIPAYASAAAAIACLVATTGVLAQNVGVGTTVQGDAFRAEGRFLRGMAWYELGSAQAAAINSDAVAAWNRAVQADYNQYLMDRANRLGSKKALRGDREQQATARMAETRRRWRENPTTSDIRSGLALNALASDLADPAIPAAKWPLARVDLPREVSIQSLAFRFADAPRYRLPAEMAPSAVALGRMKANDHWPLELRRPDLAKQRAAYQRAIALAIETCVTGKPLRAAEVDAVRESLLALREKAAQTAPSGSGLSKQAKVFLDQLDQATKIFFDRDFAEELIRDAEGHRAKNVGELLAFMKKYRLLLAEADENPEVWATYQTLYDLLKRQKTKLDFAHVGEEADEPEKAVKEPR